MSLYAQRAAGFISDGTSPLVSTQTSRVSSKDEGAMLSRAGAETSSGLDPAKA